MDKVKKHSRELQRLGKDMVSYQTCRNWFVQHGFEEAKKRVLEAVARAEQKLAGLKRGSRD